MICKTMKWSTISIITALILIIVYASSGLYTLIDVTTLISSQSILNNNNETILWPESSSSLSIILSWTSIVVYFGIVLLVIILICGIEFNKPWLLFLWSILMIIMLLVDGIVTILSLRQQQQMKMKILFILMVIRLIISLCGIFITIFHFRQLNKSQSDSHNRQRMLNRYHTESTSPSYEDSWARSNELLNPPKDPINDLTTSMSFPRTKLASIQRHPTSSLFHPRNSPILPPEYHDYPNQSSIDEYKDDTRYNIPLEERFHQKKSSINHEP